MRLTERGRLVNEEVDGPGASPDLVHTDGGARYRRGELVAEEGSRWSTRRPRRFAIGSRGRLMSSARWPSVVRTRTLLSFAKTSSESAQEQRDPSIRLVDQDPEPGWGGTRSGYRDSVLRNRSAGRR